jgi:hypothetical protein
MGCESFKRFFQNSSYKVSPYIEEKLSEVATFRECIYEGFAKKIATHLEATIGTQYE